ncbi:Rieske 2Fe-2S domain-containing protein [Nocardia brasiliensis]|uniref:Rieske 2Fe-2S domain-containing protein n=1 Tax=Nocardia brasiliensis TaxID=37326 RepID=UPI0024589842|nr:Rieske 2Fe-2S domain-containing protein [Nocardia brasiliensis]
MPDNRRHSATAPLAAREIADTAPPFPYGWYAVAFSGELRPGRLLTRQFMDREIALFRTESGIARAAEAYCPHLGAHFGHGGTVVGEELRCPFHGFRYSVDGRCSHTPYGPPPPAARLGLLPLREICGVLLVWHGPPGADPWEIEPPAEQSFWRPLRTKRMRFSSHPQEVTENSVDFGHFSVLHGFRDARITEPLSVDGPRLRTSYAFTRPIPLIGGIPTEIHIRVDGLGFSVVELSVEAGWDIRQLVLTTPIGPREVDVFVGTSLRSRARGALSRAAWAPLEMLIERGVLRMVVIELLRDQQIWDNKKYLGKPAIAAGDGPIATYRSWARQFYPEEKPQ